jgi:Pyridine nucleotide-disulphide oxidoreductase/Pyridine nucleotide-disulphide oxidoreductase, dimerisation domain/Rhodanese-like domain
MAFRVEEELVRHGVTVRVARSATAIDASDGTVTGVRLDNDEYLPADLVILSVGVRPDTGLALQVGAELGTTGAIRVDRQMRTTVDDVYAVGDAAESFSVITGSPLWRPLGSTANKMGRIAGDAITGGNLSHRGILGTGILRVFELAVGHTGLTETEAKVQGFDIDVIHNIKPAHATYVGGRELIIKAIAERGTGTLLGAQAIGPQGVDKRIDVLATAITLGAHAEDLFHLDLAYSPPFATTKDPIHYTGMALANATSGQAPLITPSELDARRTAGESLQIIDVRSARDYAKSHVPGAINVPLAEIRGRAHELDPHTNWTHTHPQSPTATRASPETRARTSCSDTASPPCSTSRAATATTRSTGAPALRELSHQVDSPCRTQDLRPRARLTCQSRRARERP